MKKPILTTFKEYLEQLGYQPKVARSRYEVSDPVPMAPPVGYFETPDLQEQIKMFIRSDALLRESSGPIDETFEEANDFEVDDGEPFSPYEDEEDFGPPVYVAPPSPEDVKEKPPVLPEGSDVSTSGASPAPSVEGSAKGGDKRRPESGTEDTRKGGPSR